MNCKQGDLAVLVHSVSGRSLGMIFTCVERYDGPWRYGGDAPGWRLDRPLWHGFPYTGDKNLRPLRDNPGADETLTWAGKPAPIESKEPA